MNKIILMGRIAQGPEIKTSSSGTKIATYSFAVPRRYTKEGEKDTDFIRCIAFGKNAEFAEKYLDLGMKLVVDGRIQTGSYEKGGQRFYTTDVIVENHYFCEKKQKESYNKEKMRIDAPDDEFMKIPDGIDEELPFS